MNGPLIVAGWIAVSHLEGLSMITHPLAALSLELFTRSYRSFTWWNGSVPSA